MLACGAECVNWRRRLNAVVGIYSLKGRGRWWIIDLLSTRTRVDCIRRLVFDGHWRAFVRMLDSKCVVLCLLFFAMYQQLRAGAASKCSLRIFC